MIKDIEYLGFAQLSYLNWHHIEESYILNFLGGERKVKKLLNDKDLFEKIKTETYKKWNKGTKIDPDYYKKKDDKTGNRIYYGVDKRIFILYSESEIDPDENPKFPEFDSWEFLCAYDHNKIYTENVSILNIEDSGFQASAFKNGNKVLIAYRGTDMKDSEDWTRTNLGLGSNLYVDQLTCVTWFYKKVKSLEPNAEIYITGHSLGGALAEFAHIYSGCLYETKTWNGLGIGEAFKIIEIVQADNIYKLIKNEKKQKRIGTNIIKMILEKKGYLKDFVWQAKCENITEIDIKEIGNTFKKEFNIGERILIKTEKLEKELSFKIKMIYRFQKFYIDLENKQNSGNLSSIKIENIYFEKDLTPNLQKRMGIISIADKSLNSDDIDTQGSNFSRKITMFKTKEFGDFHGLPNFLPFVNDNGELIEGELNSLYLDNTVKTILSKNKSIKKTLPKLLKSGKQYTLENFFNVCFPNYLSNNTETTQSSSITIDETNLFYADYIENFVFKKLIFPKLKSIIKFENLYKTENGFSYIGKFTNYDEIGGVYGSSPIKYETLLNKVAYQLDIPSLHFFEAYSQTYGLLGEDLSPYNYIKKLLNTRELPRKRKVYFPDLIYQLFIIERNRVAQLRNIKKRDSGLIIIDQIKEIIEEIAQGYTKESYEAENNYIAPTCNIKKLLSKLVSFETPNTMLYLETYRAQINNNQQTIARLEEENAQQRRQERNEMIARQNEERRNQELASAEQNESGHNYNGSQNSSSGTYTLETEDYQRIRNNQDGHIVYYDEEQKTHVMVKRSEYTPV